MIEKLAYIAALPVFLLDIVFHLVSRFLGLFAKTPSKKTESGYYSLARGKATDTHGEPRSSSTEPLLEHYDGCSTVYEMLQRSVKKYGSDKIAMQHRKFVELKKVHETDRFPSKVFDDEAGFKTYTYEELGEIVQSFGAGLRELGMTPIPDHDPDDFDAVEGDFKMVIFEDTCCEWTMALQGAFSQSMTVATCYATLGHDAVVTAVNETGATTLFVNWKNVETFAKRASEMPSLKVIIASTHEMSKNSEIFMPSKDDSIQVASFDEVVEMGKKNTYEPTPPKATDVAVIMYTSGSTGKPKGVVMQHTNLVAGIAGMITNVHLRLGMERFVSYLPLAHILALQIENVMLSVGATLCYTDPREMAKSISMYKPTIFAGVPKVYEMLKGGLEKKLQKGPKLLRLVFSTLLQWKISVLKHGGDTPASNKFFDLIAKKVFGGKLQFAVTGGGPISADLHYFARAVFNCPVIQGYALTETCVGGCFQALEDTRNGVVGPPVPCVEVILQSEPDFKDSNGNSYLHTDRKGSKGEDIIGRGEICMRGPCVSVGYYKDTQKTKEEYDKEGFFHTGDIGQFTSDGVIQIIDRKKNLVKLKGGEYVAVEAMETAFASSKYINGLCVLASGDLDGPMAVILTDNDELHKWAKEEQLSETNPEAVAQTKEARKEVIKSMVAAGKKAGLTSLELRIQDCCLIANDEWKPGHGFTASMKLDRKGILRIYEKEISAMFQRNGISISK